MQKAQTRPGIDHTDVLGFTIGFCFLPSALCLTAVLLLTYFERPGRLEAKDCCRRAKTVVIKASAPPAAGQGDAGC